MLLELSYHNEADQARFEINTMPCSGLSGVLLCCNRCRRYVVSGRLAGARAPLPHKWVENFWTVTLLSN